MKLIAIRIDNYINFEKYLHYLDKTSVVKIMSFHQRRDKIIAFTSEILKKYYLAKVLAIEPTDIKIGFNAYGKPILLNTKYKIDFNISHSGDYVIMAIVYNAGIGIDIEQINHAIKPQELGKYVFSTKELALVSDDIGSFYLM